MEDARNFREGEAAKRKKGRARLSKTVYEWFQEKEWSGARMGGGHAKAPWTACGKGD